MSQSGSNIKTPPAFRSTAASVLAEGTNSFSLPFAETLCADKESSFDICIFWYKSRDSNFVGIFSNMSVRSSSSSNRFSSSSNRFSSSSDRCSSSSDRCSSSSDRCSSSSDRCSSSSDRCSSSSDRCSSSSDRCSSSSGGLNYISGCKSTLNNLNNSNKQFK